MNFETILQTMNQLSVYASFLANIVVIIGAFPFFFWLMNKSFENRKREIQNNLVIRENIKEKLREHADGYDRTEPHDIGIRLVYWKNYPWKLDDDGYKQTLYYDTNLDKRVYHGTEFLNNTGILVEEHFWYFSKSLYLGEYGTHIIDQKGKKIPGFREIKQKLKIVRTLKYQYVVNWDFEEKIEYEPVFYTKYRYTRKKLYEDDYFIQNFDDNGIEKNLYFHEVLDRNDQVKSNRSIKYIYLLWRGSRLKRKEMKRLEKIQVKFNKKKNDK